MHNSEDKSFCTATSGDGFFVDTTGGSITVTLPSSPSAGDIVSLQTTQTRFQLHVKMFHICRNGSKINGVCSNSTLTQQVNLVTFVYVDATEVGKMYKIQLLMLQAQLLYLLQVEQKQLQEILKYIRLIQMQILLFLLPLMHLSMMFICSSSWRWWRSWTIMVVVVELVVLENLNVLKILIHVRL